MWDRTLVLDKGADIDERGKNDWTALIWGVYGSNLEVVELLLEKGADVNARDPMGRTALMYASARDHHLVANRYQGGVALVFPSEEADPQRVKVLLDNGADADAEDNDGWTALKRARKRGHGKIIDVLLAHGAKE